MLKKIVVLVFLVILLVGLLVPGLTAADRYASEGTSLLRISIWPTQLSWPKKEQINGLSIGLPSSFGWTAVNGVDFAFIWGDSQNVNGFKTAPVCTGDRLEGVQFAVFNKSGNIGGAEVGIVNFAENLSGVQFGIYNESTKTGKGAQFGIVNNSKRRMGGVQFGIVNKMEDGFLPIFPFFNFSVR